MLKLIDCILFFFFFFFSKIRKKKCVAKIFWCFILSSNQFEIINNENVESFEPVQITVVMLICFTKNSPHHIYNILSNLTNSTSIRNKKTKTYSMTKVCSVGSIVLMTCKRPL